MKAVFIEKHGGPEVLQCGDLPDPAAGAGRSSSTFMPHVNGVDWRVRAGEAYRQTKFPYVLGRDFSGVVVLGKGVQAAAAHRLSQSRHVRGKLVLFNESAGTNLMPLGGCAADAGEAMPPARLASLARASA